MRQTVGRGNIFGRHFNIAHRFTSVLQMVFLALVLVQIGDGTNETQVLHVIAPCTRFIIEEGQLIRIRIDHFQGLQQPLRVAM